MDKTNEKDIEEDVRRPYFSSAIEARRDNPKALFLDAAVFIVAFIFARCHVVFGAHPLALALLAALPSQVFIALFGAVIGSLTLGGGGIIYGMVCGVIVFLRLAVSGGEKSTDTSLVKKGLRTENPLFRISSCVIAGFVISVYELLLSGITKTSIIFGLTMIILTPLLSILFSYLFDSRITFKALLEKGSTLFSSLANQKDGIRSSVLFRISAAATVFFISLSLKSFELLGISLSFVFSALATLTVSKRFGWIYGAAVGFSAAIAISPMQAVSFALAGIVAGLLFRIGTSYALAGGCVTLSAWSAYTAGLGGFLSALPEYLIGAAIAYPIITKLATDSPEKKTEVQDASAKDMVGTMSLAYKNKMKSSSAELEAALCELAPIISAFSKNGGKMNAEYISLMIEEELERTLSSLSSQQNRELLVRALSDSKSRMIKKLLSKERLSLSDLILPSEAMGITVGNGISVGIDGAASELLAGINARAAELEKDSLRHSAAPHAEEYIGIAKMISEARCRDDAEKCIDNELTKKLGEIFDEFGFPGSAVRVFGERYKHIIAAGEDSDGLKITMPELKKEIEKRCNIKLSMPDYYRRESLVLMEATSERKFTAEYAYAEKQGSEKEISGDTVCAFESHDDRFFAILSDGMGSGELARETSLFASNFLRGALTHGFSADAVLHILNDIIRTSGEECSATVDLFEFDLMNAEAKFLKSGAAASYVKRGSSIFRIRSRTAPIGLMRTVDAERIRVEVKCEDYVIMLSDGINPTSDDAPWLLELLAKPHNCGAKALASLIINEAENHSPSRDDMSALVIKISAI